MFEAIPGRISYRIELKLKICGVLLLSDIEV